MYMTNEENATSELRFNTFGKRTDPYLEQKWIVRQGSQTWGEWRKVPFVEAQPSLKQPHSTMTQD